MQQKEAKEKTKVLFTNKAHIYERKFLDKENLKLTKGQQILSESWNYKH